MPPAVPFTGTLPSRVRIDMAGTFTLSPEGDLVLATVSPCVQNTGPTEVDCPRSVLDSIHPIARTPWNVELTGAWRDAHHLAFHLDWAQSGLDPLADNVMTVLAQPWQVSGAQWTPSSADALTILNKVSEATDTETATVPGGPAPALEVAAFEVEGNELRAGASRTLNVRIANRGPGTAYRVVATVHSSIDALHGRRLSFGTIKPGSGKLRMLALTVPATETAHDVMLVLALAEANGVVPRNLNRRVAIAPSMTAPAFAIDCTHNGRAVQKLDLDAGQRLILRCAVDNTGDADAREVEIEAAVASESPTRSRPQAIAASKRLVFDVPIDVPRSLPINSQVPIAIRVRDRQSSRTATATVVGVMRKPRLCTPGKLTRAEYQAALTEFQAQLAAKRITQAEYDNYEGELVGCLK
jgi:hypothetical protein